jgi:hypothetical protein
VKWANCCNMSDSNDPLEDAFRAAEEAAAKRHAEADQQAAVRRTRLQKWGDDLGASLDGAIGTFPSLEGQSKHGVAIEDDHGEFSYSRRGVTFQLRIETGASCETRSPLGVQGTPLIVGDEQGELNTAILHATFEHNDRGGEVIGSYAYSLEPVSGRVSVDPASFTEFLKSLARKLT